MYDKNSAAKIQNFRFKQLYLLKKSVEKLIKILFLSSSLNVYIFIRFTKALIKKIYLDIIANFTKIKFNMANLRVNKISHNFSDAFSTKSKRGNTIKKLLLSKLWY